MNKLLINNLHASIENKEILKGLNLEVNEGEVHYVMGKNGAGKSTIAKILMGHPDYEVTEGTIAYKDQNILELEPNERSHLGIYLANQYPVEVPGVNLFNFLRIAYNSRYEESEKLSVFRFKKHIEPILELLNINKEFLNRNLNEGFSGGEKKKNEILQMAILQPDLVILDETDSGLDVDSLKEVFTGISKIREINKKMSLLVITHYNRVINFLKPDKVHIIEDGRIIKEGDESLAHRIDQEGYKNSQESEVRSQDKKMRVEN